MEPTIIEMIRDTLKDIKEDVRAGRDEISNLNNRVGQIEGKAAAISLIVAAISSGVASFIIGLFKQH